MNKQKRIRDWHRNYLTKENIQVYELLKTGTAALKRGVVKDYFDIKPNVLFASGKKSKRRYRKTLRGLT